VYDAVNQAYKEIHTPYDLKGTTAGPTILVGVHLNG